MNKKIITYFLALFAVHSVAFAESTDPTIQIQMLDGEITKLTAEKQQKFGDLQKCEKSVKGFKIAGITTLGLTAVGVGVNIYQMTEQNKLNKEINSNEEKLKALKAEQARVEKEKVEELSKEVVQPEKVIKVPEQVNKDNSVKKENLIKTKETEKKLTDYQINQYDRYISLSQSVLGSDACTKDKFTECGDLDVALKVAEKNFADKIWDKESLSNLRNKIIVLTNVFAKAHPDIKMPWEVPEEIKF